MFPVDMLPWTPQVRWQGKNELQKFQCGMCGVLARYRYLGCGCPEFEDRHYMNRCKTCCVRDIKRKTTTKAPDDNVKVKDFAFLETPLPDAAGDINFEQLENTFNTLHGRYIHYDTGARWTPTVGRANVTTFRGGRR